MFAFAACSGEADPPSTGAPGGGSDGSQISSSDGAGGSTQIAANGSSVGTQASAASGVGGGTATGSSGGASSVTGAPVTTVGGAESAGTSDGTTGSGTQASSMGGTQSTTTGGTESTSMGGAVSVDTATSMGGASTMDSGAGGVSTEGDIDSGSTTSAGGTGAMPDPSCGSHKWACWPMPNKPGSGLPNEASYTDNGDGTVTDDVTGLVWQGEQPSGSYTFGGAASYCEGLSLGGADDWRMPTRIEMISVLDVTQGGAKWASQAFPGASGGFHHSGSNWILTITQTGAGAGTDYAWAFNMSDGILSNAYSGANTTPVRCVRGNGSGEGPNDPAVAPPDQYTVIATGEVRDNYTGLIWQQGDSDNMLSQSEAVSYCSTLGLNGNTWRLPSLREISTLVDEATVAPAINDSMFPDTHYGSRSNNWYWAIETNGGSAWGLNFDDGFTGFNSGSAAWNTFGPSWARCVR